MRNGESWHFKNVRVLRYVFFFNLESNVSPVVSITTSRFVLFLFPRVYFRDGV